MKHHISFQFRPMKSARPDDYTQPFTLTSDEPVILPSIGDHVQMNEKDGLDGIVADRLFSYVTMNNETICLINIVLTESIKNKGQLIKE